MKSVKLAALMMLLAGGVAMAANTVTYTVLIGGDNHAADLRAGTLTPYSGGSDVDDTTVTDPVLNWAVKVDVGGDAGDTKGVANVVFDLELQSWNGSSWVPVAIGHADLDGSGNPTEAGFYSSVLNGQATYGPFIRTENAAFAVALDADANSTVSGLLINPYASDGPNMDYYWHPSAADFKGGSAAGSGSGGSTLAPLGSLIGFGAGYKVVDLPLDADALGVGITVGLDLGNGCYAGLGGGPLFEGQINLDGLPNGNYKLVVKPSADGTNVVRSSVDCTGNTYGAGSFAVKADAVNNTPGDDAAELTFALDLEDPTTVVGRHVFYNQSYYDGNKVAIDAAPLTGANNDDDDAIDTSKTALLPGAGTATTANYVGYVKGVNGLMIDVQNATRAPVAGDFTFNDKGRNGNATVAKAPSASLIRPLPGGDGNDYRCVFTFTWPTDQTKKAVWLECRVGTGFGLADLGGSYAGLGDIFWYGQAFAEGQSPSGTNALVNATDTQGAKNNGHGALNRAKVWDEYDYNKDSLVNATDQQQPKTYGTSSLNCLVLISR